MLTLGKPAPIFDCSAVVEREVVELTWSQVHQGRTLVLQFDSIENYTASPEELLALSNAQEDFARSQAKVAVICRDHVYEVLQWINCSADEAGAGEIAFPIIVDSDDRIASMYDMLNAEGCPLWGNIILDSAGRVRQIAISLLPIRPNVEELIRCVASIHRKQC